MEKSLENFIRSKYDETSRVHLSFIQSKMDRTNVCFQKLKIKQESVEKYLDQLQYGKLHFLEYINVKLKF